MDILSEDALTLLLKHKPLIRAYFATAIAAADRQTQVDRTDAAYAELECLGFVAPALGQKTMPYHGAMPKSPYKLTEAGAQERERLAND